MDIHDQLELTFALLTLAFVVREGKKLIEEEVERYVITRRRNAPGWRHYILSGTLALIVIGLVGHYGLKLIDLVSRFKI
jgi:hypothetical protein